MISSLDDLVVSLSTDTAMIASVAGLYVLLRKGLRGMIRDEIATTIKDTLETELGEVGKTPREVIEDLREDTAATRQGLADVREITLGVSRRLDTLRTMFFSHVDRQHRG